MIITKKHLSRRTFVRGAYGRHRRASISGCDDSCSLRGAKNAVALRRGLLPMRSLARHLAS